MTNNNHKQNIGRLGGALLATTVLASLSSFITTKFLMNMAVDREAPKLMKLIEKRITRSCEEERFLSARVQSGEILKQKPNEKVSIVSHDGITLVGHWFPVDKPKRILIAVHGWRATWYQTFGLIADDWEKAGCSVLFIEQRATDQSGGDIISFGLVERFDCLDWINWVIDHFGSTLPIYLCGVSMGATTVLMATGQDLPQNVHGVISDCGYTSPHAIWKYTTNNNLHMFYGVRGIIVDMILRQKIQMGSKDYSTLEALKTNRIPVIFIHGSDDTLVPVEMTYENYKACAEEKQLLIVPGADHGMSYFVDKNRYREEINRFWEKYD
ncbi:MAG: alpha/beta hydrolase [Lachnospiraceae bacterium]|nr:alpha/beta hydrolase [Lachnospiraceae bacterium]